MTNLVLMFMHDCYILSTICLFAKQWPICGHIMSLLPLWQIANLTKIKHDQMNILLTHRTLPPQNWHSSPCQPSGQTHVPLMHVPPFMQLLCAKFVVHLPCVTSTLMAIIQIIVKMMHHHSSIVWCLLLLPPPRLTLLLSLVIWAHFCRHFIVVHIGWYIWLKPFNILNVHTSFCDLYFWLWLFDYTIFFYNFVWLTFFLLLILFCFDFFFGYICPNLIKSLISLIFQFTLESKNESSVYV